MQAFPIMCQTVNTLVFATTHFSIMVQKLPPTVPEPVRGVCVLIKRLLRTEISMYIICTCH